MRVREAAPGLFCWKPSVSRAGAQNDHRRSFHESTDNITRLSIDRRGCACAIHQRVRGPDAGQQRTIAIGIADRIAVGIPIGIAGVSIGVARIPIGIAKWVAGGPYGTERIARIAIGIAERVAGGPDRTERIAGRLDERVGGGRHVWATRRDEDDDVPRNAGGPGVRFGDGFGGGGAIGYEEHGAVRLDSGRIDG